MRLIDADELLKGRQDHEMISTHEIWNAPTIEPCEDSISREWIKDYCKKQIDHYEMRKKRILSEKAISYDPKKQIEGFEEEITIYKWILREVAKVPPVAPNRPKGLDELVEGFAKALTYEDVVAAEAEAKGYAQGFKDGMESRPSGEWIITEQDNGHKWTHRKCSECGKGIIEPLGVSIMNYCPNCGARMKGADNEHDK